MSTDTGSANKLIEFDLDLVRLIGIIACEPKLNIMREHAEKAVDWNFIITDLKEAESALEIAQSLYDELLQKKEKDPSKILKLSSYAVSYAVSIITRCFSPKNNGRKTCLGKEFLSEENRKIYSDLYDYRNSVTAHHGDSKTAKDSINDNVFLKLNREGGITYSGIFNRGFIAGGEKAIKYLDLCRASRKMSEHNFDKQMQKFQTAFRLNRVLTFSIINKEYKL